MRFEILTELKVVTTTDEIIKVAPGQIVTFDPERANRLMLDGKIKPVYTGDPWQDLRDMWLRLNSNYHGECNQFQGSTSINDLRALEKNIDNAILTCRSYSSCIAGYEGFLLRKFTGRN